MKVKYQFFETMATIDTGKLIVKDFTAITADGLDLTFEKLDEGSRHYFKQKMKLIKKHSEKDEKGEIIQENGIPKFKDREKFDKELDDLLNIEFDTGIDVIKVNLKDEPKLSVIEMRLIRPFIKIEK